MSIRERPAEAEDRAIPGHWEGDLLLGRHWNRIATVVERSTRFTVLVALDGTRHDHRDRRPGPGEPGCRTAPEVTDLGPQDGAGRSQDSHRHDRSGVYLADPRSPWQRDTNENTNRLLRQYLPKGQSMAHLPQDDLDAIAARLNSRARKTLGFDSPAGRLAALLC